MKTDRKKDKSRKPRPAQWFIREIQRRVKGDPKKAIRFDVTKAENAAALAAFEAIGERLPVTANDPDAKSKLLEHRRSCRPSWRLWRSEPLDPTARGKNERWTFFPPGYAWPQPAERVPVALQHGRGLLGREASQKGRDMKALLQEQYGPEFHVELHPDGPGMGEACNPALPPGLYCRIWRGEDWELVSRAEFYPSERAAAIDSLEDERARLERILAAAESGKNIFERTGPLFVVSYAGRRECLPDGKGLRYIREIIARNGDGITPLELSGKIHSLPPERLKGMDGHEATATPGTEADWNAIRRADAMDARGRICEGYGITLDQYAEAIAELKAGLREAIKAGDIEGAKTHRKALRELGEGDPKARTGKRLPPDPQVEQARTRVANAIRRAFDDMKKQHHAAAKHLRATVKTSGGRWRYTGKETFAT
jgi:hypothetical protein